MVMSYVTTDQKTTVAQLALEAELTQSDLVRLLLVTATLEDVERLKGHPAYLAMLLEEETR